MISSLKRYYIWVIGILLLGFEIETGVCCSKLCGDLAGLNWSAIFAKFSETLLCKLRAKNFLPGKTKLEYQFSM